MKSRFVYTLLALGVTLAALGATADASPSCSSRILVNTAPGGLTDPATRLVSQHMGAKPGQCMIVEYPVDAEGLREGFTEGRSEAMLMAPQQFSDFLKHDASQVARVVNDPALKSRRG